MSSSDPNKPIILAGFPNEMIASLLVARLRDEDIFTEMVGGLTASFRVEVPGEVRVLVRSQDLERAQKILTEFQNQKS
jgi:hypothetical protein